MNNLSMGKNGVVLVCFFACSATMLAQTSVRCWGEGSFDTEMNRLSVVAGQERSIVMRSDGRAFLRGSSGFGENLLPKLPP